MNLFSNYNGPPIFEIDTSIFLTEILSIERRSKENYE